MKQKLRLGNCYALAKHKLKQVAVSPHTQPSSAALPSVPIRLCPAYISLKRPASGILAKEERLYSERKAHTEGYGIGQAHVGAGQGSASEQVLYSDYTRIALHLARPNGVQSEYSSSTVAVHTELRSDLEEISNRRPSRWLDRGSAIVRNWFAFGQAIVWHLFDCASAFSRSVAEGLSKASRTLVEARSKDCRTSLEQQSNKGQRNIEESCVCTHAKVPAPSGLGLALGLVALLLVGNVKYTAAQESFSVRGKVISAADGAAIEGATVTNKRTRIHAVTDGAGEYSIPARPDDALIYSFLGYVTIEQEIGSRERISVVLDVAESMLEEVEINAGYYRVKAKERTGSIVEVNGATIAQQPVSDPLLALTGRVSGVKINQNSGITGAAVTVQIRGMNSIDQGNEPLYIVDGVPFASESNTLLGSSLGTQGNSPFASLNPQDIESIVVAKDADATAIYGSRGANGVVLITTKRGRQGKTKITFDVGAGMSRITRFMTLLNTQEYVEMRKEAFKNDGRTLTSTTAPDIMAWDTTRYTDLVKELIGGDAYTANGMVSLSGGSEHTNFLISSGFYRQTTVFPTDMAYKKATLSSNVNHSSADQKFQLLISANYGLDYNGLPSSDLTSSVRLPPNIPSLYKPDGKLNWEEGGYTFNNPLGVLRRLYKLNTENLIGNLRTTYSLAKNLEVQLNFGYSSQTSTEIRLNPISAYNPTSNRKGNASHGNNTRNGIIIEPQLNYSLKLSKGTFDILLGGAWQKNNTSGLTVDASGYETDAILESIGGAAAVTSSNSFTQYRYAALFGRTSYNHRGKYLLNFTARRDGSSRFGPGKRLATFGAIGGAWIFSRESFMDYLPIITSGKIRGSYGITGSDAIGNYQYLDTYAFTNNPYGGQAAMYPTRLFNPDFGWESNRKFEMAFETGLNRDKLLFSVAYYNNRSSNQLVQYSLPGQTGFMSITRNMPALLRNSGWEIEADASLISSGLFSWHSSVNLTFPKSTLLSFPELKNSPYRNRYALGKPLNLGSGFQLNGVNPETGIYEFLTAQNQISVNPSREEDLVIGLVNLDPKLFGGFHNSFRFARFQVEVFFEFKKQMGHSYLRDFTQAPGTMFNQPTVVLERWRQPGSETHIQKYTALASSDASRVNTVMNANGADAKYTDASYLRLKNVAMTYRFSTEALRKRGISTFSIYLRGQNLLTFTNYLGNDPETQSNLRLPPLRTLTAGLKLDI